MVLIFLFLFHSAFNFSIYAEKVDEIAEAALVEAAAGVVLREDAFQARVVALDSDHGVIHDFADGVLLGAVLQVAPARGGRHPEDVLGYVFAWIFRICPGVVAFTFDEPRMVFLETVGDVSEEDQAEGDVPIFRRVHVVAELVIGEPELGLEAEVPSGGVLTRSASLGRHGSRVWMDGFFSRCSMANVGAVFIIALLQHANHAPFNHTVLLKRGRCRLSSGAASSLI